MEIAAIFGIISTILSAIIGGVVFIVTSIRLKQKNTWGFINDYNNDERVNKGIVVLFSSVYKGEEQTNDIFALENRQDHDNFLFLINKLEILAGGLEYKIYDKKIIKECLGYDLFAIYTQSKPLIDIIRGKNVGLQGDKAFEKFEKLALDIGAEK